MVISKRYKRRFHWIEMQSIGNRNQGYMSNVIMKWLKNDFDYLGLTRIQKFFLK